MALLALEHGGTQTFKKQYSLDSLDSLDNLPRRHACGIKGWGWPRLPRSAATTVCGSLGSLLLLVEETHYY